MYKTAVSQTSRAIKTAFCFMLFTHSCGSQNKNFI